METADLPSRPTSLSESQAQVRSLRELLEAEQAARRQAETFLSGQSQILRLLAEGQTLTIILHELIRLLEALLPGSLICISFVAERQLANTLPTTLPTDLPPFLHSLILSAETDCCSQAVTMRKTVVVRDVHQDPFSEHHRASYERLGISSCWAVPVVGASGEVVAVLAGFHPRAQDLEANSLSQIESLAHLASLAIASCTRTEQPPQQDKWFRSLVELIPDWVWAVDREGRFSYVSPRVTDLLGYSPQEMLGRRPEEFMPACDIRAPRDDGPFSADLPAFPRQKQNIYRHRDGRAIVLESSSAPVISDTGHFIGYRGVDRDITRRKAIEEALRRAHNLREVVIRTAAEGICACSASPDYPYLSFSIWNDRMVEISGYTMEEINRLGWYQSVYPDPEVQRQARERIERMRQGDQLVMEEWQITRKDGTHRRIAISTSFAESESGLVIVALMLDVTKRYEIERSLKQTQALLHQVGLIARIGGWELDLTTRKLTWSHAMEMLTQSTQLPQGLEHWLLCFPGSARERLRGAIELAISCGSEFDLELPFHPAGGPALQVRILARVESYDDRPPRLIGAIQDVTNSHRAAEALRASEERYRLLAESGHDIISLQDMQSRYLYISPSARRITGFTDEEVIGHDEAEFLHPEDRLRVKELRSSTLHKGGNLLVEWRHRRKDGSYLWFETAHRVTLDDRGKPSHIVSVSREITQRKQAEEALQQTLTRAQEFETLFQLSTALACILDLDGRILRVNPQLCRSLGYDESELIGAGVLSFVHPEDYAQAMSASRHLRSQGGTMSGSETRWICRDGTLRWLSWHMNTDLERQQVYAVALDISAQKESQAAQLRAELQYRQLVDSVQGIIWEWDPRSRRYTFVSPQAEVLLGYPLADWYSKPQFWKDHIHPEDLERAVALSDSLHHLPRDYSIELRMLTADGRTVWFYERGNVVLSGSEVVLLCGLTIDITERKRAEDERLRLETQMRHAQKLESLGVLAGGIAHDFNNLLTGILGYAHLALNSLEVDSTAVPMLHEVNRAAHRAAELVQQMLAYAGKGKFVVQPLNLSTLVLEMQQLLRAVISKKAVVRSNLASDLPTVEGDATQIRQVIMNLLTNASDALEDREGQICVQTGTRFLDDPSSYSPYAPAGLAPGVYVFVEVKDTGSGMTEETQARIFDPFFTTKFAGRGLGLAATLGIVQGHQGLIRVESRYGQGTTFEVLFPSSASRQEITGTSQPPLDWRARGRILIIEDEDAVRYLAQACLENAGFDVLLAVDGQDGLDQFQQERERLDGVLLDLTMPRLGGLEVLTEIRRRECHLPVVLMSGYGEEILSGPVADLSPAGFVQKPFTPDQLVRAFREALPR